MFKVRRKSTGEIVTVYAATENRKFLVYLWDHPLCPRWAFVGMDSFEPVEVDDGT